MSFWSRIFPSITTKAETRASLENPKTSLAKPGQWLVDWLGGGKSRSGATVNHKTSLGVSAVWRAISLLSETMGSLPLEVHKSLPNGGSELDTSHPVHRVVNISPNEIQTSFYWRQISMAHLLLRGNTYTHIIRGSDERPSWFRLLDPQTVQPVVVRADPANEIFQDTIFYKVRGYKDLIPARDMLHVPGLGWDGYQGVSVLTYHRENLGISISSAEYGGSFFGNGAHIHQAISVPGKLSDEAYGRMDRHWNNERAGVDNAHRTEILEHGAKIERLGLPPGDAMFLETREFQVSEIARIFGVPPHLLMDLKRATFSNIEAQGIELVMYTLRQWCKRWEQELNRKLFRDQELGSYFTRFNLDGLLRGDSVSRVKYYNGMVMTGAMTPDEVRIREKMNPKGGNADKLQMPQNITFLDEPVQQQEAPQRSKPEHEATEQNN